MVRFQQGVAILSLTLMFAALGSAAPTISEGGVVNGASFLPAAVPGGGIAQGSFFTGFGTEMGPAEGVVNTSLPLPTELGGMEVTVTAGEVTYNAYLTFVRDNQFNAIMPSETPAGEVEVRVSYDGETSDPVMVTVVENSVGIFTATQAGAGPGAITNYVSDTEQPLNSSATVATPGQVLVVWGTGLLGIPGADHVSPLESGNVRDLQSEVDVTVMVGGRPAQILYAGRSAEFPGIDQISIQLAEETPSGCFVPVMAIANGTPSNEVTIAVGEEGAVCQDALNPFSQALIGGASVGALANVRLNGMVSLSPILSVDFTLDVMAGSFSQQTGAPFSYNRFFSLPPVGSCSRQTFRGIDLVGLLGGDFPDLNFGAEIDAGPSMMMTRDGGDPKTVEQDEESEGRYVATVGGGLALVGEADPTYYEPGEYNITSEGGEDVGAIDVTFTIPERPEWTNRDAVATEAPISRAAPLTFTWEPGDPQAPQVMLAFAANVNVGSGDASGVVCLMPQTFGMLTMPPALLSTVAPSEAPGIAGPTTLGFVGFGSLPVIHPFQAEGLDLGAVLAATLELQSATFE